MSGYTPGQLVALPMFSALSSEQCECLLQRHVVLSCAVGQVVVMEEDWGEALYLLCSGLAKVRTHTAGGEEVVMSVLGNGDLFGEMALLDGGSRSADVVALTAVDVLKLQGAPFLQLLQEDAGFALAFARLEVSRLRDLNQRFALQASDATTRLLAALAYLARRSSAAHDPQAPIPCLAQREIGLLAGLSRETASRTLSKLRSQGVLVEEAGCLRIVDLRPLLRRGLLLPAH